jgi:hypothetical protein
MPLKCPAALHVVRQRGRLVPLRSSMVHVQIQVQRASHGHGQFGRRSWQTSALSMHVPRFQSSGETQIAHRCWRATANFFFGVKKL